MSIGVLFGTATGSLAQQALDFDTVMAKEGGYAGIVKEFLGTSDPKIIAFVKREGDQYIASLPADQGNAGLKRLQVYLKAVFQGAKDGTMSQGSIDFIVNKVPQFLIEFIPYERDYPNLASKGKLVLANQNLQKSNQDLQRATQELERAKELNRRLGGQRP